MEHIKALLPAWRALLAAGLLAACSGPVEKPAATLPPTPEVVQVLYTPSAAPVLPALAGCAAAAPQLEVFTQEISPQGIPAHEEDTLAVRLGSPDGEAPFAAQVAEEQVAVILHPENPLPDMQTSLLHAIFSGAMRTWKEAGAEGGSIQVWTLPEGFEPTQQFKSAVMAGDDFSDEAWLAADPATMLEEVGADPAAVGYVPAAWLDGTIHSPRLERDLSLELRLPVLVTASAEPQAAARTLLACLQSGRGQEILRGKYHQEE